MPEKCSKTFGIIYTNTTRTSQVCLDNLHIDASYNYLLLTYFDSICTYFNDIYILYFTEEERDHHLAVARSITPQTRKGKGKADEVLEVVPIKDEPLLGTENIKKMGWKPTSSGRQVYGSTMSWDTVGLQRTEVAGFKRCVL